MRFDSKTCRFVQRTNNGTKTKLHVINCGRIAAVHLCIYLPTFILTVFFKELKKSVTEKRGEEKERVAKKNSSFR